MPILKNYIVKHFLVAIILQGEFGHNVRNPQYAAAPFLQWLLSKEQKYFDAASELMDYKTGLNPLESVTLQALVFTAFIIFTIAKAPILKVLVGGRSPELQLLGQG